jgi:hypothetical protein
MIAVFVLILIVCGSSVVLSGATLVAAMIAIPDRPWWQRFLTICGGSVSGIGFSVLMLARSTAVHSHQVDADAIPGHVLRTAPYCGRTFNPEADALGMADLGHSALLGISFSRLASRCSGRFSASPAHLEASLAGNRTTLVSSHAAQYPHHRIAFHGPGGDRFHDLLAHNAPHYDRPDAARVSTRINCGNYP